MKPRGKRGWVACLAIMLAATLAGCGGGYNAVGDGVTTEGGQTSGTGTTVTALHSMPKELAVGDAMIVDVGDAGEIRIDFSGVDSSAKFILAVGSYNETGASTSVQLSADLSLPEIDPSSKAMAVESEPIPEDEGYGAEEIMSAWLRASEEGLADQEVLSANEGMLKSMSIIKAMSIGDTETFRVLSSLSSVNSYVEVRGSVRCVEDSVAFYVDATISADVLSDADVQGLCSEFNRVVAEEQALLGNTSDVDGDGRVHVLMTSQINKLGALGGGVITGYYYAGDEYERSQSNPTSNHREVIYTMVPDEAGQFGYAITKAFAMQNLLPAVLPHELQHAISYNQHVLVNGGQPEENWLNEGLSHLAEDLMGHNRENPSRYSLYLASPSTYGFLTQSSPNLMERGASYLFLRYMYEQASDGNAFMKNIEQTNLRGVANLEAAFAGAQDFSQFPQFVSRWVVTLAMSDRGISQDSRFTYRPRTKNAATGEWQGVMLEGDVEDGRGTQLNGVNLNQYNGYHTASIDGTTAKFYNVTTVPEAITIAGSLGGGNFGALIRYQ
ncbi:MAG: hypothetical protein WC956_03375 [bacterium]